MRSQRTDGLLLVDKPAGMTSHDVVGLARRALGERRVGHAGTLDPFATGLLVLLVGRATRVLPYLEGEPKVYDATIRFGTETDTDDLTGAPVRHAEPPTAEGVRAAVADLTGDVSQVPPRYSAKQVSGRRAHAAARRGQDLELAPVTVRVHEWILHEWHGGDLDVTITCGGGTYVRALARDLGRRTGSAAHLTRLRRTHSGPFAVAEAIPVDRLPQGDIPLRSPLEGLPTLPRECLDDAGLARVAHGNPVPAAVDAPRAALVDADRELVAIAERAGAHWHPRVVLREP